MAIFYICLLAAFTLGAFALAIRLILGKPAIDGDEREKRWWWSIK